MASRRKTTLCMVYIKVSVRSHLFRLWPDVHRAVICARFAQTRIELGREIIRAIKIIYSGTLNYQSRLDFVHTQDGDIRFQRLWTRWRILGYAAVLSTRLEHPGPCSSIHKTIADPVDFIRVYSRRDLRQQKRIPPRRTSQYCIPISRCCHWLMLEAVLPAPGDITSTAVAWSLIIVHQL